MLSTAHGGSCKTCKRGKLRLLYDDPVNKSSEKCREINEIGEALAEIYGVKHLPSDFKKKNGYKRSIELSHDYGLIVRIIVDVFFSKREQEEKSETKTNFQRVRFFDFFTGM